MTEERKTLGQLRDEFNAAVPAMQALQEDLCDFLNVHNVVPAHAIFALANTLLAISLQQADGSADTARRAGTILTKYIDEQFDLHIAVAKKKGDLK